MPFIVPSESPAGEVVRQLGPYRAGGGARPGALESRLIANGLVLNDQDAYDRYFVKNVDGLWGADIRDTREPRVNDDGEDVYDTLLGGKTVTISGRIEAHNLDIMRDMESNLEQAFPHNFDYPILFDRTSLRRRGIQENALADKNFCTNPTVQTDTSGYSTGLGPLLTRETSFYKDINAGDYYMSVEWHAGSNLLLARNESVAITAGEYIQVGIDVFITESWSGGDVYIDLTPRKGASIAAFSSAPWLSDETASETIRGRWQRVWKTIRYDDATDGTRIDLSVYVDDLPLDGDEIRFTAVMIRVTSDENAISASYFDGETAGWRWQGVPFLSASSVDPTAYRQDVFITGRRIDKIGLRDEQTNQWFRREFQIPLRLADPCIYGALTRTVTPAVMVNLAPNPGAEAATTTGWAAMGGASITTSTTWKQSGTRSFRVTGSAAGVIGISVPTGTGGIPITGGKTYSASVVLNYVVKSNGASGGKILADMYFYDAAGTIITGSATTETTSAGIQTLTINNITAPGNAAFLIIRVYTADNVNAAVDFYIDAVMINEGSTPNPYFDGSSALAYWQGTANNSKSSQLQSPMYVKNNGNYLASPRLRITGPWTNFSIVNSTLLEGEIVSRRFSITGSIPDGTYWDWDEEDFTLIDNGGTHREGLVDSSANGLRLGPGTNFLTLGGTGLTAASLVSVSYEDTWK